MPVVATSVPHAAPPSRTRNKKNTNKPRQKGTMPPKIHQTSSSSGVANSKLLKNPPSRARVSEAIALVRSRQAPSALISQDENASAPTLTSLPNDPKDGKALDQKGATPQVSKSLFRSSLGRPVSFSRRAKLENGTKPTTNCTISPGEASEVVKSARKVREEAKAAKKEKEKTDLEKKVHLVPSQDSANEGKTGAGSRAKQVVPPMANDKISPGEMAEVVKSARKAREAAKAKREVSGGGKSMRDTTTKAPAVPFQEPLSPKLKTQSPRKHRALSPSASQLQSANDADPASPRGSDGVKVATATSPTKSMSPHGTFLLNIFASRASDPGTLAMPTLTPNRDQEGNAGSCSLLPSGKLPRTPSKKTVHRLSSDGPTPQSFMTRSVFGSSVSSDSYEDGSVDPQSLADASNRIDTVVQHEEDQCSIDNDSAEGSSLAPTATLDDALVADVGRFIDNLNQRMDDALEQDDSVNDSDIGTSLPSSAFDQAVLADVGRFIDAVNKHRSGATETQRSFSASEVASKIPATSEARPAVPVDVDALNQDKGGQTKEPGSVKDARLFGSLPARNVLASNGPARNISLLDADDEDVSDAGWESTSDAVKEDASCTEQDVSAGVEEANSKAEAKFFPTITLASASTESYGDSVEPRMLAEIGRVIDSVATTKVVHIQEENNEEVFSDSSEEESVPEETMAGIGAFIDALQHKGQTSSVQDAPSCRGQKMYVSSSDDTSEHDFAAVVPETEEQIRNFISSMEKMPDEEEQRIAGLESSSEKENDPPPRESDMNSLASASEQVQNVGGEGTTSPNRAASRAIDLAVSKDSWISQNSCGEGRLTDGSRDGVADHSRESTGTPKSLSDALSSGRPANENVVSEFITGFSPFDTRVVVEELDKLHSFGKKEKEDEKSNAISYSIGAEESESHESLTSSPVRKNLAGENILRSSRTSDTSLSNEGEENTARAEDLELPASPLIPIRSFPGIKSEKEVPAGPSAKDEVEDHHKDESPIEKAISTILNEARAHSASHRKPPSPKESKSRDDCIKAGSALEIANKGCSADVMKFARTPAEQARVSEEETSAVLEPLPAGCSSRDTEAPFAACSTSNSGEAQLQQQFSSETEDNASQIAEKVDNSLDRNLSYACEQTLPAPLDIITQSKSSIEVEAAKSVDEGTFDHLGVQEHGKDFEKPELVESEELLSAATECTSQQKPQLHNSVNHEDFACIATREDEPCVNEPASESASRSLSPRTEAHDYPDNAVVSHCKEYNSDSDEHVGLESEETNRTQPSSSAESLTRDLESEETNRTQPSSSAESFPRDQAFAQKEFDDLCLKLTESSIETQQEAEDVSAYFNRKLIESNEEEELDSGSLLTGTESLSQIASWSIDSHDSDRHVFSRDESSKVLGNKSSILDEDDGLDEFKLMGIMEIDTASSEELEKVLNSSVVSSNEQGEFLQQNNVYENQFGEATDDELNLDLKASDLIDALLDGTQEEKEEDALVEDPEFTNALEQSSQEIGQLDFILDFIATKADDLWEGKHPSEEEINDLRRSAQRMGVKPDIIKEIIVQKQEQEEEEELRIKMAVSSMKSVDESDNIDSFFTRMTTDPEGASVEEIQKVNCYSNKVAALIERNATEEECAALIGNAKRDGMPAHFISNMYRELFPSTAVGVAGPRGSASIDSVVVDDNFFAEFAPAEGAAQSEVDVLNYITKKVDALWKGDKRPSEAQKDELRRAAKVMGVDTDLVEEMIKNASSKASGANSDNNKDEEEEKELCLRLTVSSMESVDENENIESFLTKMTRDPHGATEDELSKLNYYAKKVTVMCGTGSASEEERMDLIGEAKQDELPVDFINIIYDELFKNTSTGERETERTESDISETENDTRNAPGSDFFTQFAPAVGVTQSEVDGLNLIANKANSLWEGGRRPSLGELDELRRSAAEMNVPMEFVEELISRHSIVLTAVLRSTAHGNLTCTGDETDDEDDLCLKMTVSSMKSIDENDNIASFLARMTTGFDGVNKHEIPKVNFYSRKAAALLEHRNVSEEARTELIRCAKRDGLPAESIDMLYTKLFERSPFEDRKSGDLEGEEAPSKMSDCVDAEAGPKVKLTPKSTDSAFFAQFAPAVGATQAEVDALNLISTQAHALWEGGRQPSSKDIDRLRHASEVMGVPTEFVEDLITRNSIVLTSLFSKAKEHHGKGGEYDKGLHMEEKATDEIPENQIDMQHFTKEEPESEEDEEEPEREDDEEELLFKMTASAMQSIDEDENIESFLTKRTTGPEGASEEEISKLNYYSKRFAEMLDGVNKSEEECSDLIKEAELDGLPDDFIDAIRSELFTGSNVPGADKSDLVPEESMDVDEHDHREPQTMHRDGGEDTSKLIYYSERFAGMLDGVSKSDEEWSDLIKEAELDGLPDDFIDTMRTERFTNSKVPGADKSDLVPEETTSVDEHGTDEDTRIVNHGRFATSVAPAEGALQSDPRNLDSNAEAGQESNEEDKIPSSETPDELSVSPPSGVADIVLNEADELLLTSPRSAVPNIVVKESTGALLEFESYSTSGEEEKNEKAKMDAAFRSQPEPEAASTIPLDDIVIPLQPSGKTNAYVQEATYALSAFETRGIGKEQLVEETSQLVEETSALVASFPGGGEVHLEEVETIPTHSAPKTCRGIAEDGESQIGKAEECVAIGSSSRSSEASPNWPHIQESDKQSVNAVWDDEKMPSTQEEEKYPSIHSSAEDTVCSDERSDDAGNVIQKPQEMEVASGNFSAGFTTSLGAPQTVTDTSISEDLAAEDAVQSDELLKAENSNEKSPESAADHSGLSAAMESASEDSQIESNVSESFASPCSSTKYEIIKDEFVNAELKDQTLPLPGTTESNLSVDSGSEVAATQTEPSAPGIIMNMVDVLWEDDKVPSKQELDELLRASRSAGVQDEELKEMVMQVSQSYLKSASSINSVNSSDDSSSSVGLSHDKYDHVEEENDENEEIDKFLSRMAHRKADKHLTEAIIETFGSMGKSKTEAFEVDAALLGLVSSTVDAVEDEKPWWQEEDEGAAENEERDGVTISRSESSSSTKSTVVPNIKIDSSWCSSEEADQGVSVRHSESMKQTIASPTDNSFSSEVHGVPSSPRLPRSPMPPRSPMVRSGQITPYSKKGSPLSIFTDIEQMFEKRESYYTTQNLARWTSPWAGSNPKSPNARSKIGGARSIGGVAAARAIARWSPRIRKRHRVTSNRIWKQSYEERTKAHPGYFDVDVYSVYSTSLAVGAHHPLDEVPWENRDVKQRFLFEKSVSFSRNWFGDLLRKRGNDRVREPVAYPKSMVMPIENVIDRGDWHEEWYTTWQSRKDLGDIDDSYDDSESYISFFDESSSGDESEDSGSEEDDEEYSDGDEGDDEPPECGTIKNVRQKIGERVSRVHPVHTSSLRRSRWRKKYFPRGTFPY